jgi:hypothetical protein
LETLVHFSSDKGLGKFIGDEFGKANDAAQVVLKPSLCLVGRPAPGSAFPRSRNTKP